MLFYFVRIEEVVSEVLQLQNTEIIMSKIEQYDAKIRELATEIEDIEKEIKSLESKKRDAISKKSKAVRSVLLELIHDKDAFEQRCLKEMGVKKSDIPECFCTRIDERGKGPAIVRAFHRLTWELLGLPDPEILFQRSIPKYSIFERNFSEMDCFGIDDCMTALRKRLAQDLFD